MQYGNWMQAEELDRMRRDELHRELERERFMAAHGLDLWSVLRRSITRRLRPRRARAARTRLPAFAREGRRVVIR